MVRIEQLDDQKLSAGNIAGHLLKEFTITTPLLLETQTEIKIDLDKHNSRTAPEGYSPGQGFCSVYYTVPVGGSYELFKMIFQSYQWKKNSFTRNGKVCYREISKEPIIGNPKKIEIIRSNAKSVFSEINQVLSDFKNKAEVFNSKTLTGNIQSKLDNEKKKRAEIKAAEKQLHPF